MGDENIKKMIDTFHKKLKEMEIADEKLKQAMKFEDYFPMEHGQNRSENCSKTFLNVVVEFNENMRNLCHLCKPIPKFNKNEKIETYIF